MAGRIPIALWVSRAPLLRVFFSVMLAVTWCGLLLQPIASTAQPEHSPYRLSWTAELSINLGGASMAGVSEILKHHKSPLSSTQINQLSSTDIWKPDRFATENWSTRAATASDVFMIGTMALPALLWIDRDVRKDYAYPILYFETMLVTYGITGLTKELAQRKRPFVYHQQAPLDKKQQKDALASFFSGHTSMTAAAAFFGAKSYSDYFPDSKFKPYLWAAAATLPAVTGYLRIRAGKHYLSDVVVGYAVGMAVGILIPRLHRKDWRWSR